MDTPEYIKCELKDVYVLANKFHAGSFGDRDVGIYAGAMVDELNDIQLKSAICKLLEVIRCSGRASACLPMYRQLQH